MLTPLRRPTEEPTMSNRIPATLIAGDGIGPEIVEATLAALDALGAPFDWEPQVAGLAGVTSSGDPLPKATLDSIRRTRLALKGPLETPSGGGYRSSNVRLREEFKLYANLRPVAMACSKANSRMWRQPARVLMPVAMATACGSSSICT
jgi:isocitrate/isopropylmalate dehydrogenase